MYGISLTSWLTIVIDYFKEFKAISDFLPIDLSIMIQPMYDIEIINNVKLVRIKSNFTEHFIFWFSEIQNKLESEKISRQRAEQKLLETEKKKSELSVDLSQLQSQTQALKQELKMEIEKVRTN